MDTMTATPPITRFEDLDLTKRYTYADYFSWKFQERVELFRGWVSKMAGPNMYHQKVSVDMTTRLKNHFDPRGCEVFCAPTDVLLARSPEGDTVVQPDLLVICDKSTIKEQYVEGAPDWLMEIVSPGNGKKELGKKYEQYEAAGVREYWVLHPID